MNQHDPARLAEAWVSFQRAAEGSSIRAELDWADEKVWKLTLHEPDQAWRVILEILEVDSDDMLMENLSAGPLEDLLSRHGDYVIDRVEQEVRSNSKFCSLPGGVWQNAMPDEIWERVQAARGTPW